MNTQELAKALIAELPLSELDIARLFLESAEHIGDLTKGKDRCEMMMLMRRLIRAGSDCLHAEESTVPLREAVLASVHARRHLRPVSQRDLRFYARRILAVERYAEVPLNKMTPHHCRTLLEEAFGCGTSLYGKARTMLHSVFAYGMRREWCTTNPVKCLASPKMKEQRIVPLTPAEVERLKQAVRQPAFRDMKLSLILLLYCGIRPAEVARLKAEDICRREKQVIIHPSTSKTGGGRIVPIRCSLNSLTTNEWVIPRNWSRRWRELRRAAGFHRWRADLCRHTFASYHAAYFRNLNTLQMEMGHRDVTLLRTRYVAPAMYNIAAKFWKDATFDK